MADLTKIKLPNNQEYNLKDGRVSFKSSSSATYSSNVISNIEGNQYAVTPDKDGYLSVNIPIVIISNAEIDDMFD